MTSVSALCYDIKVDNFCEEMHMHDEFENGRRTPFSCRGLLLVSLLSLAVGCGENPTASGPDFSKDSDEPEEKVIEDVAIQLTVTQEPSALEAFRQGAAPVTKASEPFTPAQLEELELISRKALPAGISNELVVAQLEAVLNKDDTPSGVKANALGLLLLADDKKGQDHVITICRQDDSELKRQVLLNLSFLDSETSLRITNPVLIRELHDLIRSPVYGHLAMNICVGFGIPGTEGEIWRNVPDAPADLKAEMAFWLTRLKLDRRTFELCSNGLSVADKKAHHRYLTAMEHFVEGEDQVLAQEVLERMADDLLNLCSQQTRKGMDFPQGACGTVLKKGKGRLAEKLADRILTEPPERDQHLYQLAYTAKRQGEREQGVTRLLKDLTDKKQSKWAREAVVALYKDSGNSQISAALWKHIQGVKDPHELLVLGSALFAVGGENAKAQCQTLARQLPDTYQQALLFTISKDAPLSLAKRFIEAGFLASNRLEVVLSNIKDYQKETYGDEPLLKMDAHEFLLASKMVAFFDVETDELPVRHDKLILELALISGGLFAPTCCRESFIKEAGKKDPFTQPYHVAFIHGDRLYRFVARNFGDWYDLERVLIACNKALEDRGVPQRFREIEGDGQCASVAFITPEQERLLSDSFYLSFGKDPNTALKKGKAFEAQVKEQLLRP
jgi:hypothetical protein